MLRAPSDDLPFQYQVYLNRKRSYRELPMRLGETSTLFRNEDSGEMHGLIRVRQFTISEGHLVLRPDQLEEEFLGCVNLMKYFLGTLGLLEDCTFRFSQWDPNNRAKYEGTPEQWDEAQATMKKILDDIGLDYKIGIDEAAFYGPKLDVQCKNVFGKEDTIVTIQIDMLLAREVRYVLHRQRQHAEDTVHHPPHISRLLRAYARTADREVRGRVPGMALAHTGDGSPDIAHICGLCRDGDGEAQGCRRARGSLTRETRRSAIASVKHSFQRCRI